MWHDAGGIRIVRGAFFAIQPSCRELLPGWCSDREIDLASLQHRPCHAKPGPRLTFSLWDPQLPMNAWILAGMLASAWIATDRPDRSAPPSHRSKPCHPCRRLDTLFPFASLLGGHRPSSAPSRFGARQYCYYRCTYIRCLGKASSRSPRSLSQRLQPELVPSDRRFN